MRKRAASSSTLLLLPTLGATLDISIALCLALLIRFFEELDVLNVTVIIFFESAIYNDQQFRYVPYLLCHGHV